MKKYLLLLIVLLLACSPQQEEPPAQSEEASAFLKVPQDAKLTVHENDFILTSSEGTKKINTESMSLEDWESPQSPEAKKERVVLEGKSLKIDNRDVSSSVEDYFISGERVLYKDGEGIHIWDKSGKKTLPEEWNVTFSNILLTKSGEILHMTEQRVELFRLGEESAFQTLEGKFFALREDPLQIAYVSAQGSDKLGVYDLKSNSSHFYQIFSEGETASSLGYQGDELFYLSENKEGTIALVRFTAESGNLQRSELSGATMPKMSYFADGKILIEFQDRLYYGAPDHLYLWEGLQGDYVFQGDLLAMDLGDQLRIAKGQYFQDYPIEGKLEQMVLHDQALGILYRKDGELWFQRYPIEF